MSLDSADMQHNGDYFAGKPLQPMEIERGERLLYRLTEFGRLLWESGINVGPRQMLDLDETLNYVDVTNKEDFYNTLKCSLLARHEQEAIFNQMFLYYWYMRDQKDKKAENPTGAAKRDDRKMRLPPSERKRFAEHLNANEQQRRDLKNEMRQSGQHIVLLRCYARKISNPLPGKRYKRRRGLWPKCTGIWACV